MAVWTIKSGTGSGTALVGCKIIETKSGRVKIYQFIPVGATSGPTTTTNPPTFTGITYKGRTDWSISSTTSPPLNPPPNATWSGSCNDGESSVHHDEPGTWVAEPGGGGMGEEKPPRGGYAE